MNFSNGFLQELKSRNDIVDLISRYAELKNIGANLKARCPFHSEKTPSFMVYRETQSFYCFGCGAGGDVITFMMKYENIDYLQAIERLADFAKMEMPQENNRDNINGNNNDSFIKTKRIYELNKIAARYFYNDLIDLNSKESAEARAYIAKRGLNNGIIRRFGLGYARSDWYNLAKYLTGLGYSKNEIKASGLCFISKKGVLMDYFRGRIMFPIIDVSGNVIGFGGRIFERENSNINNINNIDISKEPKYLNSSDTQIFKKSKNLYGMNFAKDYKENANDNIIVSKENRSLIMCEGYMDVISMHQAGFTNAVASLGTAVTEQHARLIAKYANKVILAYDMDEAGRKASKKAADLLGEVNVAVSVLKLENAKDPDEYINKFGREKFKERLRNSKGYAETELENIYEKYNNENSSADDILQALKEACIEIAKLSSNLFDNININNIKYSKDLKLNVQQEVYGVKLAEKYKVSHDLVFREIKKYVYKMISSQKVGNDVHIVPNRNANENDLSKNDLNENESKNDLSKIDLNKSEEQSNIIKDIANSGDEELINFMERIKEKKLK